MKVLFLFINRIIVILWRTMSRLLEKFGGTLGAWSARAYLLKCKRSDCGSLLLWLLLFFAARDLGCD